MHTEHSSKKTFSPESVSVIILTLLRYCADHDDASGIGGRKACSKGASTQACEGDDAGRSLLLSMSIVPSLPSLTQYTTQT